MKPPKYFVDDYESELAYLNSKGREREWAVFTARTYSSCQHCGETITVGETFLWHPDSLSIHIDCVELMQGFEHAMSREN